MTHETAKIAKALEDLAALRTLIEDENHWCQHFFAQCKGEPVGVFSEKGFAATPADQWCVIGAYHWVKNSPVDADCEPYFEDPTCPLLAAMRDVSKRIGEDANVPRLFPHQINDWGDHPTVMSYLDEVKDHLEHHLHEASS